MTTLMQREPLTGPGAWRADTIDAPASWYYPLPARAWAALDEALNPLRRQALPATGLVASAELRAACAPALRPARDALESGRGFAVIDRVPLDRYSADEA